MNALSLFSSIGIGELFLKEIDINVVVANELVPKRALAYQNLHDNCEMITGSIAEESIKKKIIKESKEKNIEFALITPPCQGLSSVGINKTEDSLLYDKRNYLILHALDIIDEIEPSYILIENVPRFLRLLFPHEGNFINLESLLLKKYGGKYHVKAEIMNAANFSVPQTRLRAVFRMWKKNLEWNDPVIESMAVTVRQSIGDLPTLEAGMKSEIKNHWARSHPLNQIEWMKNTPTGSSAFLNEVHFPRKENGEKVKGFKNTYRRIEWDKPAPTITMRNEIISSQENVHPGRLLPDGTWSDARVLTPRELLILSSCPPDMEKPANLSDNEFRQLVGEGIPPLMLNKIVKGIVR